MNLSHTNAMTNHSNITLRPCKHQLHELEQFTTVKIILLVVVGMIGIFNNGFIMVIVARFTERRNLHHLILNIIVSDALVILVTFIHVVLWLIDVPYDMLALVVRSVFIFVDLATLLIITIERFRITRRSRVQISQPYTLKQRVAVLACSWLISTTLDLPCIIMFMTKKARSQMFRDLYMTRLALLSSCCCAIILLSIITMKTLSHPQVISAHLSIEQQKLRKKKVVSAVKMVLCSILLCMCCYPHQFIFELVLLTSVYTGNVETFRRLVCFRYFSLLTYSLVELFTLVNACLNPCIYIFFLSDFREGAKTLLSQLAFNQQVRVETRSSLEMNAVQPRS